MTESNKDSSVTRKDVLAAKGKGQDELARLIKSLRNSGELVFVLENIGSIPTSFGSDCFLELTKHENKDVRLWAVKNLGKLKSVDLLSCFMQIVNTDTSTSVKREAVSSIGRMRKAETIPSLLSILHDSDPKIVCQAIRGLLVFKGNEEVDSQLKELIHHENEMVVSVIKKEYFGNESARRDILPHTATYPFLINTVVHGDVRDVLKYVPDQSIHLTFTSPPYYNARDYSIYPSYEAYLKFLEEVFLETYRITKEGRFLIVNTSPVIVPRISRAHSSKRYPIPFDIHHDLIRMGWEFIDDIIWMKPEYSVKNRIGGFQQHRRPLAYKPNTVTEYLMVYRKQTSKLIDWNIHQYSHETIEQSRVPDNFETSNVWQICPKSDKVHSAIFPYELCKRVIEYYSFVGDLVFDPFGGSGTVGRSAKKLNRHFFLTEKDQVYFDYMKSFQKENMFEEAPTRFLTLEQFKNSIL
ncbi:MAG: HEAT repeat domain-containing protein [Bacteroidaceae bacterium]|nr:HEAT repeat domain-containing protein [Bacteroidaceae bacterium]